MVDTCTMHMHIHGDASNFESYTMTTEHPWWCCVGYMFCEVLPLRSRGGVDFPHLCNGTPSAEAHCGLICSQHARGKLLTVCACCLLFMHRKLECITCSSVQRTQVFPCDVETVHTLIYRAHKVASCLNQSHLS